MRVRDLHAFRCAIVELAGSGMVVVPTVGAAIELRRLLRRGEPGAESGIVTRDGLYEYLHASLVTPPYRLTPYERDVMAQAAAREAVDTIGADGALHLRPGLVAAMLRFYDQLRRQGQQVARFEALLIETLERDVGFDRGAERMLRQTNLLAETFRSYERRVQASGACDEHVLRERLLANDLPSVRALTVTVADWIAEPDGLYAADFDVLSRLHGLETIDLIATEAVLESGFHQRLHDWLPGLQEINWGGDAAPRRPMLAVPADLPDRQCFLSRDREEELVGVARRISAETQSKETAGSVPPDLERMAVVYKRPLPYVYLAREVFGGAGLAYQTTDTLPLAAEPVAAALDLVLEAASSSFTRVALVSLLRSPHLLFLDDGMPIDRDAVSALDRALSERRYLGEIDHLSGLVETSQSDARLTAARPGLRIALTIAKELAPLRVPAAASLQVGRLVAFLDAHTRPIPDDDAFAPREQRARAAVIGILKSLAAASRVHDDAPMDADGLAAAVHRWIEEQTFALAPETDRAGLHLLDERAARYGDFDDITVVGLLDGEWPDRERRNIFYPPGLLASLGWPSEKDWWGAAEARFIDLLQSAATRVRLSTVTLDEEALVQPSPLLDVVPRARLTTDARELPPGGRIFVDEALSLDPVATERLDADARRWAEMRLGRSAHDQPEFHGTATGPAPRTFSVSSLETYLACPFKYFAQHVLHLEEDPDDEEVMDPRRQGQFVHGVFEAFFRRWQFSDHEAVTPENLGEARAMFEEVVEDCLRGLSDTEAALERTRLLGSSAAAGLGDAVLRMEAERPLRVVDRLLEYKLDGSFTFETASGSRAIALRGKADRVDVLADGTFRLIDYKLGWPPNRTRALQLPIYSVCVQQQLERQRGTHFTVSEASYLAFKGPRRVVPLFAPGDRDRVLLESQERLVGAVDAIERGEFPPRPDDVYRCETCAFAAVCRKDYVGDV